MVLTTGRGASAGIDMISAVVCVMHDRDFGRDLMDTVVTPRRRSKLAGTSQLSESGVAELTLTNVGSVADVYRVTAETEFHERAVAEPATIPLQPGASRQVRIAAHTLVAVCASTAR